jgi:hypothetical protein
MRLSTLLSKHLTDAANNQESNSVNYFNLCDQKRWQISKNDLCRFDSQFSIESKNEIKLGRFHLKKHNFSVFNNIGTFCIRIYRKIFRT